MATADAFKDMFNKISALVGDKLNADTLTEWLKSSKVIDNAKIQEAQVKKAFEGGKIDFEKFQNGLQKIADESKIPLEEIQKKLLDSQGAATDNFKTMAANFVTDAKAGMSNALAAVKK